MNHVTIKFDPNQEHQNIAVESVAKLFDGLSRRETEGRQMDEIVPNLPPRVSLDSGWLLDNLQAVQRGNGITEALSVETDSGYFVEGVSTDTWEYPVFTVEMETGTGKTYVYLKTMYELRRLYGFRKFVVVVPSLAIYEGVVNAFKATREHFKGLYGNENVILLEYDGEKPVMLRDFAVSTFVEILLMTVDSFNKKSNVVYKRTENQRGERLSYQYVQETRPILILDESQNYRSEKSRAALRTLKPLFAVNYSATPGRDALNMIYRLTPFAAFQMKLVKKIEVLGMIEAQSTARHEDYLKLLAIEPNLTARFIVMANVKGTLEEQEITVKKNASLKEKTHNAAYEDWIVEEINYGEGWVGFKNGERFVPDDERCASLSREAVFRRQIEETIVSHIEKQRELRPCGVKVLSLFFIDRVASYTAGDGVVKRLFDESFERLKVRDAEFKKLSARQVREGYFAKKKEKTREVEVDTAFEEADKKAADKEAEKHAYELIMKRKERLLAFEEPVSFVFAHSALKEGWDNPNVFQICALREITSEKERRQTIGRGLRLPVRQDGLRLVDEPRLNTLTVVANESYAGYVSRLQQEYAAAGDVMPQIPADGKSKEDAKRNGRIFGSRDFVNFWNRLIQKTEYDIVIDTDRLVEEAIGRLNNTDFPEPRIIVTKGAFIVTNYRIDLLSISGGEAKLRVERETSTGSKDSAEHFFKKGADLAKLLNDPVLKPFKITDLGGKGDSVFVEFSEGGRLTPDKSVFFSTEKGQVCSTRSEAERVAGLPKPNLVDRASKELSITRATVLRIFSGLAAETKKRFVINPEGFAGIFISVLRETLAEHVTAQLEYRLTEEVGNFDLEETFPAAKKFPKKELVAGNESRSLYDLVQKDSDNEEKFVQRLNDDDDIVLYFKFPPAFKIGIPRLIGNYNPDWGILRWDEKHRLKLELVRETKGAIDLSKLHYSNEGRKVRCARKHFASLGMSYRHVTGDTTDWWKEEDRSGSALPGMGLSE